MTTVTQNLVTQSHAFTYRASQYLSMFSCNKPMCLYKCQTHVSNYCKFQLSSDTEKNPGPTPVCIDPSKTIMAPYS